MDFSALSFMRPLQQSQQLLDDDSSSMDSITLGQLKSMVGTQPKQRVSFGFTLVWPFD